MSSVESDLRELDVALAHPAPAQEGGDEQASTTVEHVASQLRLFMDKLK